MNRKLAQFILCGVCLVLSACGHAPRNSLPPAANTALAGLAEHAADLLATQYPPGHTVLALDARPSEEFRAALETSLRGRGFTMLLFETESTESGVVRLTALMDPLGAPNTYYLYLRASDGFSVGQVYQLTDAGFAPVGTMTRTEAFFAVEKTLTPLPGVSRTPVVTAGAPTEEWRINPGPLQEQLGKWCARSGYQVVWKAANDYIMESNAIFRDEFVGAVQRLFARMHQSGNGLRVRIYPENEVLEVLED